MLQKWSMAPTFMVEKLLLGALQNKEEGDILESMLAKLVVEFQPLLMTKGNIQIVYTMSAVIARMELM